MRRPRCKVGHGVHRELVMYEGNFNCYLVLVLGKGANQEELVHSLDRRNAKHLRRCTRTSNDHGGAPISL